MKKLLTFKFLKNEFKAILIQDNNNIHIKKILKEENYNQNLNLKKVIIEIINNEYIKINEDDSFQKIKIHNFNELEKFLNNHFGNIKTIEIKLDDLKKPIKKLI